MESMPTADQASNHVEADEDPRAYRRHIAEIILNEGTLEAVERCMSIFGCTRSQVRRACEDHGVECPEKPAPPPASKTPERNIPFAPGMFKDRTKAELKASGVAGRFTLNASSLSAKCGFHRATCRRCGRELVSTRVSPIGDHILKLGVFCEGCGTCFGQFSLGELWNRIVGDLGRLHRHKEADDAVVVQQKYRAADPVSRAIVNAILGVSATDLDGAPSKQQSAPVEILIETEAFAARAFAEMFDEFAPDDRRIRGREVQSTDGSVIRVWIPTDRHGRIAVHPATLATN